jgi:hypothetical protein
MIRLLDDDSTDVLSRVGAAKKVRRPSAVSGRMIAANLNRCWKDDNGRNFRSTLTAAHDAMAGVNAINNRQ